jgi:hypothetical protein
MRYVASQGTSCISEEVEFVKTRGASVHWLNKDIRNIDPFGPARKQQQQHQHQRGKSASVASSVSPSSFNSGDQGAPPGFSLQVRTDSGCPPVGDGSVASSFANILQSQLNPDAGRPLHISISTHALSDMACPGKSCRGSDGFQPKEIMDICIAAGACPNVSVWKSKFFLFFLINTMTFFCCQVSLVDLSGFNPDVEEMRSGVLVAEMIYFFLMGFSLRPALSTSDPHLASADTASFLQPTSPSSIMPSMGSYFPKAIGSKVDLRSPTLQSSPFQDDPFFYEAYPLG